MSGANEPSSKTTPRAELPTELPPRIGCSTLLFSGHERSEALDAIAAAGYTDVDLWAAPQACPHVDLARDEPAATIEDARGRGLHVHSLSVYGHDRQGLELALDWAADAGVRRVVFHPFIGSSVPEFAEFLGPYAARAERLGVEVALENHIDCALDSLDRARQLFEAVPSKAVTIALASVHTLAMGESLEQYLSELPGRIGLLYLWDVPKASRGVAWLRRHWPELPLEQFPGYGKLDFGALAELWQTGDTALCVHSTDSWSKESLIAELMRTRLFLAQTGWNVPVFSDESFRRSGNN